MKGGEPERKSSFCAVADQIVSKERSASFETSPVAPLMSGQLLVRDAMAGIPVHVEEAVGNLVLGSLTAFQKDLVICLYSTLEKVVVRTVYKVVN